MKYYYILILITLVSCEYQNKGVKNKPSNFVESDSDKVDNSMADRVYKKKLIEGKDYYGSAECVIDTVFESLFPNTSYTLNDSSKCINISLEHIEKDFPYIIGRIYLHCLPIQSGIYYQNKELNRKYDYNVTLHHGCIGSSLYEVNDSIPDSSFVKITNIDKKNKSIHGEFELHLKQINYSIRKENPLYLVIKNGKFNTKYH